MLDSINAPLVPTTKSNF